MPPTPKTIRLRTNENVRDLIDRGAAVAHKSRSEFILEASVTAAQTVLLDQTYFKLSPAHMAEFLRIMATPLSDNTKLVALLAARAPWEKS
jgi:uncharacterized protein (DUF1778 family)